MQVWSGRWDVSGPQTRRSFPLCVVSRRHRTLLRDLRHIGDPKLHLGPPLVMVESQRAGDVEFAVVAGGEDGAADGGGGGAEGDGLEAGAVVGGEAETDVAAGADDYPPKPLALEEPLARTRALGRRFSPDIQAGDELRCGEVVIDTLAHTARIGLDALDLTATEWSLLEFFVRHRGQALTRDQILAYVWSYDRDVQTSMVDLYVSYLRRKLNTPAGDRSGMIQTVRGVGYRFEAFA